MAASSTSDADLWLAWCGGDSKGGRALFDRYFKPISRFFASKVGPDHDDLVQDTFAACMAGRERLREPERFRSYLFGVAYNTLRAHYRKRHGLRDTDELGSRSVHDLAPGASTMLRGDELQRLLVEALQQIPLELQVLVELRYWEALSSADIERALEIPAATVRTRLRRARKLLREALEQLPAPPAIRQSALEQLEAWAAATREAAGSDADADDSEPEG